MYLECEEGGHNVPTPSRSPQKTTKTPPKNFDFLTVHNESGKVKKFWTSRLLFSWSNSHLKKVWEHCATPTPIGLKKKEFIAENFTYLWINFFIPQNSVFILDYVYYISCMIVTGELLEKHF